MSQTLITYYFSKDETLNKKSLKSILFEAISKVQDKVDSYLNYDNIEEDIYDNIEKFVTNKNNMNILINKNLSDIEIFLSTYQKINNCIIDRENFYKYLEKLVEDNMSGFINRCLECNVDMGRCNPRQLCGKWRCYGDITSIS